MRESDVNFNWIAVFHYFVNSSFYISFLMDFIRNLFQNRVYSGDSSIIWPNETFTYKLKGSVEILEWKKKKKLLCLIELCNLINYTFSKKAKNVLSYSSICILPFGPKTIKAPWHILANCLYLILVHLFFILYLHWNYRFWKVRLLNVDEERTHTAH